MRNRIWWVIVIRRSPLLPWPTVTDRQACERLRSSNPALVAGVIESYVDQLYDFGRVLLGDPSRAELATHNTLVVAKHCAYRLTDPDRFAAWLYALQYDECHRRNGATERGLVSLVVRYGFPIADVAVITGAAKRAVEEATLAARDGSDAALAELIARPMAVAPPGLVDRILASVADPVARRQVADGASPLDRRGFPRRGSIDRRPFVMAFAITLLVVLASGALAMSQRGTDGPTPQRATAGDLSQPQRGFVPGTSPGEPGGEATPTATDTPTPTTPSPQATTGRATAPPSQPTGAPSRQSPSEPAPSAPSSQPPDQRQRRQPSTPQVTSFWIEDESAGVCSWRWTGRPTAQLRDFDQVAKVTVSVQAASGREWQAELTGFQSDGRAVGTLTRLTSHDELTSVVTITTTSGTKLTSSPYRMSRTPPC